MESSKDNVLNSLLAEYKIGSSTDKDISCCKGYIEALEKSRTEGELKTNEFIEGIGILLGFIDNITSGKSKEKIDSQKKPALDLLGALIKGDNHKKLGDADFKGIVDLFVYNVFGYSKSGFNSELREYEDDKDLINYYFKFFDSDENRTKLINCLSNDFIASKQTQKDLSRAIYNVILAFIHECDIFDDIDTHYEAFNTFLLVSKSCLMDSGIVCVELEAAIKKLDELKSSPLKPKIDKAELNSGSEINKIFKNTKAKIEKCTNMISFGDLLKRLKLNRFETSKIIDLFSCAFKTAKNNDDSFLKPLCNFAVCILDQKEDLKPENSSVLIKFCGLLFEKNIKDVDAVKFANKLIKYQNGVLAQNIKDICEFYLKSSKCDEKLSRDLQNLIKDNKNNVKINKSISFGNKIKSEVREYNNNNDNTDNMNGEKAILKKLQK